MGAIAAFAEETLVLIYRLYILIGICLQFLVGLCFYAFLKVVQVDIILWTALATGFVGVSMIIIALGRQWVKYWQRRKAMASIRVLGHGDAGEYEIPTYEAGIPPWPTHIVRHGLLTTVKLKNAE